MSRTMSAHPGCSFVADTTDGFEDDPEDTQWLLDSDHPQFRAAQVDVGSRHHDSQGQWRNGIASIQHQGSSRWSAPGYHAQLSRDGEGQDTQARFFGCRWQGHSRRDRNHDKVKGITLDRRQLLEGGAVVALLGAGSGAIAGRARGSAPVGLADITVRRELVHDYAGTLRQVALMGYRLFGFRLSSYVPNDLSEPAPKLKAMMVRDTGMEVGVVRLGLRSANHDADLEQAVAIGAKIVALTTAPVFIAGGTLGQTTRAAFDAYVPQLAALGEKVRAAGLTLAYHNHWYDLAPLDGDLPLDLLARQIPASLLSFEIDLAWAWYAGVAPLDLLGRLGPRVVSMHFKDIDRKRGKAFTDHAVAVGNGEMDYAALLPRIRRLTSATGYVEVDSPDDGLLAAVQAMRFIKNIR